MNDRLFNFIIISLLLFLPFTSFAQQTDLNIQRSQQFFEYVQAGKGDSAHAMLSSNIKQQVTVELLSNIFTQLQQQAGKFQGQGAWKSTKVENVVIYYSDLTFENTSLRFITSFDSDGMANTFRITPIPTGAASDEGSYDKEKLEEKDMQIVSGDFKLPATLTMPRGGTNLPVVILVHGSGPNNRNESVGKNHPFQDLAFGLAMRGVAVIRYDKRTYVYGQKWLPAGHEANIDDETVDDAVAAVDMIKTLPQINAKQVFVVGHSLGAMLAPRIAERAKTLAGIVMIAGNARPLEDLLVEQVTYINQLTDFSGMPNSQIEELKKQVANIKKIGTSDFDESITLPLGLPKAYWLSCKNYSQLKTASNLQLPMLIMQGERDYQVTMKDFELWQKELLNKKNVQFKSYPKLNHLLQEGVGQSTPFEYNEYRAVPNYVMDDIATFIKKN